jgi:hypothetical protein
MPSTPKGKAINRSFRRCSRLARLPQHDALPQQQRLQRRGRYRARLGFLSCDERRGGAGPLAGQPALRDLTQKRVARRIARDVPAGDE